MQPPYAWPSFDAQTEKTASVIADILTASFNQSGTKIRDGKAILSAARHVAQSGSMEVELDEGPKDPLFEQRPARKGGAPYAWPMPDAEQENNAALVYQVLRASFVQSGTKIKNDAAILSAARHVSQSDKLKIKLAG